MVDLRKKIKEVIDTKKDENEFFVLDDNSVELIQQIFNGYEVTNKLHQDFENIPKNAELIFVAAPTGAGKDSLVIKLNTKNPDKHYIELNMDIFRHYYSEFIPGEELKDKTFAKQTNQFAYEMYVTIQEILLFEFPGTNVIITGTLRETDWVEETFRKYKSNQLTNYTIRLVLLAVPKKESEFSVIKRYIDIVDNMQDSVLPGTARYTSKEYHDETYEKFPVSVKYFEDKTFDLDEEGNQVLKPKEDRLIDAMEVHKRSKIIGDTKEDTLIYSSEKEKYKTTTAFKALEQIRKKNVEIDRKEAIVVLEKMKTNQGYLENQGILKDVALDLAALLSMSRHLEAMIDEQAKENAVKNSAVSQDIEDKKIRKRKEAEFFQKNKRTEIPGVTAKDISDMYIN
jgi:hypothetical protein